MPQRAVQKLRCALTPVLLITAVLLVTACGCPAPLISPESTTVASEQTAPIDYGQLDDVLHSQQALGYDSSRLPVPFRAGSEQRIEFERISLEQGLSQSSVYCILQDRKGFMWFGTRDGLNKYDGYSFAVYKPAPGDTNSLAQNSIRAIYEDTTGNLWVGTDSGGLDRFDRDKERFTHYQHEPNDPHSLSSDAIRSIYEDQESVLWVGTAGGGLNKFDRENEGFVHYQANPSDSYSLSNDVVWTIYEDREGVLWIGTDGGLDRFDQEERFVHYQNNPADPNSLSSNSIRSIYEDRSGVLWVGTEGGGLNRFDRSTEHFTHYQNTYNDPNSLSSNQVRTIFQDREGVLWIGTDNGLDKYDQEKGQFVHYQNDLTDPYSLSSDYVMTIYGDRSGVLWIGTEGGGVNKFDRSIERFAHYQTDPYDPHSLSSNYVRAIYQDREGILWIGTHGGGLNKFDRENKRFTHYRADPNDPYSLSSDVIWSICEDQEGTLWVGTEDGGLNRFDRSTMRFVHYQNNPDDPYSLSNNTVLSILQDHEGVLWVGTSGGGLDRFDRSTEHFIHYQNKPYNPNSLSSNYVRVIYEDQEGVLWIGTAGGGLNQLDREKGQFIRYSAHPKLPSSLSDDTVLSIYEGRSSTLWIGTAGGGLNRFNQQREVFIHYREKDGLPNDVVYGILEDNQGNLWLSTNKGLSKFNPRTERFTNYSVSDGLQSNEFNAGAYFKSVDGEMFFGGLNGFNAFYPEKVKDNPYVPPIVLTSLTQGGEDVDAGQVIESLEEVTFYWPNDFFEFEFAALSYNQPERNQYAYMLEGIEEDWNYIGTRRSGRYTNLPGGTYTLRMKASNNDGVWNKTGTSVIITIVPPYWQTWWFRGIVALVLLGSAIGGYRLRIRSIEARNRELETRIEERTAELRQEIEQRTQIEEALRQSEMEKAVVAERSRLARDLHDVVTQTLFSASLVAEALPTSWERDHEEGRQLLEELRQLTRGAMAEMRTLLLELRPAALVEANLGDLLHQLAEAATGREGVPITVTVEGKCELPPDVHIALYRIAQEALNNVVKYACANQATVSLRCSPVAGGKDGEESVELRVSDDGHGFDPDSVPSNRLGLSIMRERAQAIGATLTIESQPGRGTRITAVWEKDRKQANDDEG